MGYSYTVATGRLCCDSCDNDGGVRKIRCPYGYCPAPALCPPCKVKHADALKAPAHASCRLRVEEMRAAEADTAAHIAAGRFVRSAALATDDDRVHVLFRGHGGQYVGRYMTHACYDAFPILSVRTIEDYAALEPLADAPADFKF